MSWDGKEKRTHPRITVSEEQLAEIAGLAAKRALELFYEDFYGEIGKVTVRSLLYICGAAGVALATWLGFTGQLK